MSLTPVPPALEPIARRTFAFFPPILNVEHNEWRFRKATWSEILVVNAKSDLEVWIPRRFLGEIASIDEPVMIVGLLRELEYKAGTVWPHEKRLLEMPRMAGDILAAPVAAPAQPPGGPAPVVGMRAPPSTESRIGKLIAAVLLIGVVACFIVVSLFRQGPMRPVKFTALDQDFLGLTRHDDYFAVVRKLGAPREDRWRSETGELQYRALWYPERSYYVILLGTDRKDARYIGALDKNWRVVHYVELPGGGSTSSILRGLQRF